MSLCFVDILYYTHQLLGPGFTSLSCSLTLALRVRQNPSVLNVNGEFLRVTAGLTKKVASILEAKGLRWCASKASVISIPYNKEYSILYYEFTGRQRKELFLVNGNFQKMAKGSQSEMLTIWYSSKILIVCIMHYVISGCSLLI